MAIWTYGLGSAWVTIEVAAAGDVDIEVAPTVALGGAAAVGGPELEVAASGDVDIERLASGGAAGLAGGGAARLASGGAARLASGGAARLVTGALQAS